MADQQSILCRKCGLYSRAWVRFCDNCGSLLVSAPVPTQAQVPQAQSARNPFIGFVLDHPILTILLAVIAIVILGVAVGGDQNTTTPQAKTTDRQMRPATYDELAQVISSCGSPNSNHPQELQAGAGSEGRALVYRKYNTELWFYRGPDSQQWMLMNAFPAGGDQTITVAEANRRMPCMKGHLQNHLGSLEQEAEQFKKQLGLDNPIKARKDAAASIDRELLDMGIESKTYTEGKAATVLVIEDPLAGRVRANQIAGNTALMTELKMLGFKTLKYNNGVEGEMYTGFHWDLTNWNQ
jgi:hypothetical protein